MLTYPVPFAIALNDVHSDFANSDITSTDSEVEHSEVEEKTKTVKYLHHMRSIRLNNVK